MKKFLLLFSVMFCAISSWAEDVTIGIFTYSLDETTSKATVTGLADGVIDTNVTIPSIVTHGGTDYEVTTIAESAFAGCTNLVTVTISDGITTFGESVFSECSNLTTVYLPESLVTLSDYTFDGCVSLESLSIPANVANWGTDFVQGCTSLKSIYIVNPDTFFSGVCTADDLNAVISSLNNSCTIYLNEENMNAETKADVEENLSTDDVVEKTFVTLTIGTTGYATFSHTSALDFTDAEVNAYIVSAYVPSNGEVILTRINYVPAETGIVVKGNAGVYGIPTGGGTIVLSNMLEANLTATDDLTAATGYTNYVLGTGSYGIGFYESDGTLGANKAYLPLPTDKLPSLAPARGLHITFNDGEYDDVTGIVEVEDDRSLQGEGVYYNLQGQRVERPTKGIYIVNGKKVFLR